MHFGTLLKTMRKARGLSQAELAKRATVSDFTISSGETEASCPWKKSTAILVLTALADAGPLTENEIENFLQLAGLEALARHGAEALATLKIRTAESRRTIASTAAATSTGADPDDTTAHDWVQRLIDEAGATRVLAAIEGLAAGWQIDLPPRVRREDRDRHGAWIYHGPIIDAGDGRSVQIHAPAKAAPPTSGKDKRKRGSA